MTEFTGRHILVVEDNLISYKLMEAHLVPKGMKLHHAKTGDEAIEIFHQVKIDLVLMDVQLPSLSGIETTRIIKGINPEIPVIATTANVFNDERDACMQAGCNEYLSKPIQFPVLFDVIRKLLA